MESSIDNNEELENESHTGEDDAKYNSAVSAHFPSEPSIIRKDDSGQASVPLWLITFTDVMALMLTFFVLLYAMSVPEEDKWNDLSASLALKPEKFDAKAFNAGGQDVIDIEKVSTQRALDLGYLQTLINNVLQKENIQGVHVLQNENRLIISMPSELLFETAQASVRSEGKKLIFTLSGILSRIKNRVEVVGHADPRRITGVNLQFRTNWELSLARAVAVRKVLQDVGYDRPVSMRGLSSGRYDELPDELSEEERFMLARRVDLVILNDQGYRNNMVEFP